MQQDANKTNAQLLEELRDLRQRNTELEAVVSNLKETNKLLKENEERFRAIADCSCDWESWVGNDGRLMGTSKNSYFQKRSDNLLTFEKSECPIG